jgi:hypothetical protein
MKSCAVLLALSTGPPSACLKPWTAALSMANAALRDQYRAIYFCFIALECWHLMALCTARRGEKMEREKCFKCLSQSTKSEEIGAISHNQPQLATVSFPVSDSSNGPARVIRFLWEQLLLNLRPYPSHMGGIASFAHHSSCS